MDEETPVVETPPAAPRSGGKFKKIVFITLPLLLILGAGGWWMFGGTQGKVEAQEVRLEETGVVPLETFLVNLSDPGGNRFLKATLQLVVPTEAEAKHITESPTLLGHARSAILELLTEQNAQALVTAEGKQKLKDAVKAHVAKIFGKTKVIDVLFSEFVVQF